MARRGRRPGDTDTREQILESARASFAAHGYHRATIRLIASDAGVDPALVHHYFGTKEDLFAAAVHVPFSPAQFTEAVFAQGVAGAGEALARLFFTVWENESSRALMLGQLRGMIEGALPASLPEFVQDVLVPRIAAQLEGPNPKLRAEMAASHLIGAAIIRYVARIEPVASTPVDRLVELLAPRIQTYLSE